MVLLYSLRRDIIDIPQFSNRAEALEARDRLSGLWGMRGTHPEINGYGFIEALPKCTVTISVVQGTQRERMTEIAEAALRILRPARNQI